MNVQSFTIVERRICYFHLNSTSISLAPDVILYIYICIDCLFFHLLSLPNLLGIFTLITARVFYSSNWSTFIFLSVFFFLLFTILNLENLINHLIQFSHKLNFPNFFFFSFSFVLYLFSDSFVCLCVFSSSVTETFPFNLIIKTRTNSQFSQCNDIETQISSRCA